MMNAKLRVLLFALVLIATMIGEGESFFGGENGPDIGRKRSMVKQVEVWNRAQEIVYLVTTLMVNIFVKAWY